jgi:hypothetical protein
MRQYSFVLLKCFPLTTPTELISKHIPDDCLHVGLLNNMLVEMDDTSLRAVQGMPLAMVSTCPNQWRILQELLIETCQLS